MFHEIMIVFRPSITYHIETTIIYEKKLISYPNRNLPQNGFVAYIETRNIWNVSSTIELLLHKISKEKRELEKEHVIKKKLSDSEDKELKEHLINFS